jgi:hypothetical protein
MPDYAGTLQRLVVSRTLWLIFAWPLAGLAWQLAVVRTRVVRSRDAGVVLRALGSARLVGTGCTALAATAVLGHAFLLSRMPAGARALVQPIARGVRYGDVDVGLELLLDVPGLAACGLACAVTLGAAAVLATRPAAQRGWRAWAWLQLALAGALVSFLGDGFLTVALGWALAAAAGAWLAGWHDGGLGVVVGTRGAAAIAALLVGSALLFWGLGGSWDDDGYTPDPQPQFAAVHAGTRTGDASLTMTTVAGATVYIDEARASSLRAPFVRAPVAAGTHAIRVHPGDGADDAVLARAEVAPGEEITLVPLGPTLTFHAMADELALHDRRGAQGIRRAVEDHAGPGGFPVVAAALLVLLGAGGAMSAWAVPVAAPRALVGAAAGATTTALGPFLLMRLAFLFPSAPRTGMVIVSVGVAVVVAAVWQALRFAGAQRWLVFAGGAPVGLTLVALGRGQGVVAEGVMIAAGLAGAGAFFLTPAQAPTEGWDRATLGALDDALLARVPARLGELVASMERWVLGAVASAVGGTGRVVAWTLARADDRVVSRPADAVASRLARAARTAEPWLGTSLARVCWALLAAAALVALVHAAWPRG